MVFDHPTEKTPGDASTLPEGANPNEADIDFVGNSMPPSDSAVPPLTASERLTIARWVDLGCPISRNSEQDKNRGWFCDDLRPTLTLSSPRAGTNEQLDRITIGMHDYYSGLDETSLEVTAGFEIDGVAAGKNLASHFQKTHSGVWQWKLTTPLNGLAKATMAVSVKDRQGNVTRIDRSFSIGD